MLVITCGAIPDDHIGLHDCDNPPCVNPEAGHVRIGTRSENTLAMSSAAVTPGCGADAWAARRTRRI